MQQQVPNDQRGRPNGRNLGNNNQKPNHSRFSGLNGRFDQGFRRNTYNSNTFNSGSRSNNRSSGNQGSPGRPGPSSN